MKIRQGFELRQVGDDYVVITIGDATAIFNGMIKLNSTSVYMWKKLQDGIEVDALIDAFASDYNIDKEIATRDVNNFINSLKKTNCFED